MTAAEVQMWFDVWAADDLLGDAIGTLTKGSGRQIRGVADGIGEGSFTINRNDAEFASLCATDNLIRVRLIDGGPFDYDDERYVFAFFIERGEDTIVSTDEEGGENVSLHGQDAVVILRRAVIDYVAHFATNIAPWAGVPSFASTAESDGQWHINSSDHPGTEVGTPGGVLRVFLRDATAQTPEPIPEVTHDFSTEHDSVATPWANGLTDWTFDVGADLLTVLGILINAKLHFRFRPSLLMQAYEDDPGTDLSGSITFEKGVNVRDAGVRPIEATQTPTRVLVRGSRRNGGFTYRWVADTGLEATPLGVRQGFLDYQAASGTADGANVLDRAGTREIAAGVHRHDGPPTIGVLNETGTVAFVDYFPGDTVHVVLPELTGDYPIHAITLVENDAGFVDPILEFLDDSAPDLAQQYATSATVAVADPFFETTAIDFIGSSADGIRFRPAYGGIGASAGDNDVDVWMLLIANPGTDRANFEVEAYNAAGDYASLFIGDPGFFGEGNQVVFDLAAGNLNDDSKFFINDGYGIVVRSSETDSDPGAPQSEDGQLIYSQTTHTFRWYNGTIWQDVGTGAAGTSPTTVGYAESNTPGATHATPGTSTPIPFDTFYDVDQAAGALPAGLGLSYSGGVFTADEDGVWIVNVGVSLVANPGSTGYVRLDVPNYGFAPRYNILTAANPAEWQAERTVVMKAGDTFMLSQLSAGSAVTQVSYAEMDIVRTATVIA